MKPLTIEERDRLLRRYAAAMTDRSAAAQKADAPAARKFLQQAQSWQQRYLFELPQIPLSCCPFDGEPLVRSFDHFGLDGLWWRRDESRPSPPPCRHFCVLRGAVNFHGRPPQGGNFEAHTGPEVPYVIPRLLQLPTMLAVIGQISMDPGYTAYTVTYFAERRPPAQELTADWPDNIFHFTTALGEKGWLAADDPWDFDLRPWLQKNLVRWCLPGSDNKVLGAAPPDQCPYLDLPGARQRIIVEENSYRLAGLPG